MKFSCLVINFKLHQKSTSKDTWIFIERVDWVTKTYAYLGDASWFVGIPVVGGEKCRGWEGMQKLKNFISPMPDLQALKGQDICDRLLYL